MKKNNDNALQIIVIFVGSLRKLILNIAILYFAKMLLQHKYISKLPFGLFFFYVNREILTREMSCYLLIHLKLIIKLRQCAHSSVVKKSKNHYMSKI